MARQLTLFECANQWMLCGQENLVTGIEEAPDDEEQCEPDNSSINSSNVFMCPEMDKIQPFVGYDELIVIISERTVVQMSSDCSHSFYSISTTTFTHAESTSIDIANFITQPPVQLKLVTFPVTMFGGKPSSFSPKWYDKHTWLEYSVKNDAIFCYVCLLFFCPVSVKQKISFRQRDTLIRSMPLVRMRH